MIFLYKSKTINSEEVTGEIESTDVHTAIATLRKKGLIIISVSPKAASRIGFLDKFLNTVTFTDIVTMTRQLATMISAGLVLSEAIDILEEQQDNKKLKEVLGEISHDIKGGLQLAQALGRHQDVFPPLYVNLVRSGEISGKLDEVLLQMADSLEKEREFEARVKGALIYPVVVITMMVAVIIIMMVFVIPRLTSLYKESTLELPMPTKILIGISDLFVNFWWVMLAAFIGMFFAFKSWVKTPQGAYTFDN